MILRFPSALWQHRELWWRLTEREVLGRYRGSILGVAWSFLNPLAMLAVYTFIFSQVFRARWGNLENSGPMGFAINLFTGLIVFNLFAECASRAPTSILINPNYVKKVIFPLEILPAVTVGSAVFHGLTSLGVLALFELLGMRQIPIAWLWLPLVWLPLLLGCMGLSWLLSALGVFLEGSGPDHYGGSEHVDVYESNLLPLIGTARSMAATVGAQPIGQRDRADPQGACGWPRA